MDLGSIFGLKGKTAVITGGGGDLCSVIARGICDAGARVAVLDIDKQKAQIVVDSIRSRGGEAMAFACDVLDTASIEKARDAVVSEWGKPNLLINGAGGNMPGGSTKADFIEVDKDGRIQDSGLFDLDFKGVEKTFDLNFYGSYLPTMVFSKLMVEAGSGSILNISSMGALTPLTKIVAYSAAKAAVSNFTAWLAVHFAKTGVRVNAIAPGFLMTEQLKFLHIDQSTGELTPRAHKVIAHTPMGRYGKPEELVGAVLYLLSDASSFVTGITLPIDGGFSSYSI
ncbi:MAG: SDR family oxidoreductase [Spirochaetota bacterium]